MSVVLINEDFPGHPQALRAGQRAVILYVYALCHIQREKTGGFISDEALMSLGVRHAQREAGRLVQSGLWRKVCGGYEPVQSPHFKLPRKRASLGHLRAALVAFWGSICAYCGRESDALHIEHIQPVARGGSDLPRNLTLACQACNYVKGTRTAEEFGYPQVKSMAERFAGG